MPAAVAVQVVLEKIGTNDSYTVSPLNGSSPITVTTTTYPITVGVEVQAVLVETQVQEVIQYFLQLQQVAEVLVEVEVLPHKAQVASQAEEMQEAVRCSRFRKYSAPVSPPQGSNGGGSGPGDTGAGGGGAGNGGGPSDPGGTQHQEVQEASTSITGSSVQYAAAVAAESYPCAAVQEMLVAGQVVDVVWIRK